ncbi:MAG: Ig-like domain-containing protein, partial [Bacteroidetes bacterium]|nr:Ig-like domain-containing protein [Bacteroidota bacterium]
PYTYTWSNPSNGNHSISAKAYDNANASTSSASSAVTVNAKPAAPNATSPIAYNVGNNASPLSASGTNLKWYTVASGGNSSATAPTPSTSSAGTTNYYVSQTINGCESDRKNIVVNVSAVNQAPSVQLTSPTNNSNFCEGSSITISASANDGDGSIAKVEFYDGTTLLNSDNSAPYTFTWNNPSNGNHSISAKAYDNANTITSSASSAVTVNAKPAAPNTTATLTYNLNDQTTQLSATGSNLKWYSNSNNTSTTAPTPNSSNLGSTTYYVSQTLNGCESDKKAITVNVAEIKSVSQTNISPQIDGSIETLWNNVAKQTVSKVILPSINNDADLSGYFKFIWDNQYLYVLTEITDDKKMKDSQNFYEDDAIEIYFDINNDKAKTYGSNDVQYTFRWNDNSIQSNPSGRSSSGINFSMVASMTGYIFEARIPWTTLSANAAVGEIIGFDLHVNDDDDGGSRDGKMSWNSSSDNAWQDPSLFGTIALADISTSITDITTNSFAVYPNPFQSNININGIKGNVEYHITDNSGREVQNGFASQQIYTNLIPGLYHLTIIDADGISSTFKVVKME